MPLVDPSGFAPADNTLLGYLANTSDPTLGDALIGVKLVATGATARTQHSKNADVVSVKDFGAVGDGVTDDTAPLQLAMNWVALTDGRLEWPAATYKITSALTIAQINGANIIGEAAGSVTISQATDNTPIFKLTTCDSADFEISGFTFIWANQQTSAQTSAVAIYFDGTIGTPSNGFYNFKIHSCIFAKGYRSVSGNSGIQLSLWGWDIYNLRHKETMVGACVFLQPTPSIGIPDCSLRHLYLRADVSTEPLVNLTGIGGLLLENIEINNGTLGGAGNATRHILLTSCNSVVMHACREESATISATTLALWYFASSFVKIASAEFAGISVNAALSGFLITADGNSKVSVENLNASIGTIGGAADISMFNGSGFGILHNFRWTGTPGTYLLYPTAIADRCIYRETVSADNGNAAKTLTVGTDVETQVWNTPISIDRAVTLSNTPVNPGAKFRIIRTAACTGAFNLNVGAGPLKAMGTAGSFCEVTYNGATSAWMLTAYGTL